MIKIIKKHLKKSIENYSLRSFTILFQKKINEHIKITSPNQLSKSQKKEIKSYFSNLGYNKINTKWHQYYTGINNKFFKEYIPEDIFYTKVQPVFVNESMTPALTDKNFLSKFFTDVKQPITIIKNINGYYFSKNDELIEIKEAIKICSQFKKMVIKPSIESGGGKNVLLYENNFNDLEETKNSLSSIFKAYSQDFIIQEVVKQNQTMKLLNNSSLNTIRIMSYLKNTEAVILSSALRIGSKGQFTDNLSQGGFSSGIKNNGRLKPYVYDIKGRTCSSTELGFELENFQIPFYDKVLNTAKILHEKMPHFKLISWDLAIDDTGSVVLIEFNSRWQDINLLQINNGPLFGEFTEEILMETSNRSSC